MIQLYRKLEEELKIEFREIIISTKIIRERSYGSSKLRIHFIDDTFLDIWLSERGKYSFHWEQRMKRGLIHRYDNAPDFPEIRTFPAHFHDGEEKNVKESLLDDNPEVGVRQFLKFIKQIITKEMS